MLLLHKTKEMKRKKRKNSWKSCQSKEAIEEKLEYILCEFNINCNRSTQKLHRDQRLPGVAFCLEELAMSGQEKSTLRNFDKN